MGKRKKKLPENPSHYMQLVSTLDTAQLSLLDDIEEDIRNDEREVFLDKISEFLRANVNSGELVSRQIRAAMGMKNPRYGRGQ
jgi:hypothetical protein